MKKLRRVLFLVLVFYIIMAVCGPIALAANYLPGDAHVHTYLSGEVGITTGSTVERWVGVATNKRLGWFAVTDHSDLVLNNKLFKDELTLPEWSILKQETDKSWSLPVLLGEEVTIGNGNDLKTKGHLLTYNIDNPIRVFDRSVATTEAKGSTPNRRRNASDILPDIKANGGFSFIAHPYTSILPCDTWQTWGSVGNNLDVIKGMELYSAGCFQGNAALKKWQGFLKQQRPFWAVGNSDTHNIFQRILPPFMASSYTSLLSDSSSESDILNALKSGRAVASNGPSLSLSANGKYPGDTIKNIPVGSKLQLSIDWDSTTENGNPVRIRLYDQTRDLTGSGIPIDINGLAGSITTDYEVKDRGYILAKIETDKGKTAYTNPIFIKPSGVKTISSQGISVALIIDCSGSMSINDPQGLRKEAAKLFIDLAQPGDKIAVIGFDEKIYNLAPLTEIKSDSDKQSLKVAVDEIGDWNMTNIDAAMEAGYNELITDISSNKKAAILLTDGMQSIGEFTSPERLYKSKGWTIYTVGLGNRVSPYFLNRMASETGGRYYNTYKPEGISAIYYELSQTLRTGDAISNSSLTIQQGQVLDKTVHVSSNNMQAMFNTCWTGSDVKLTLIAPDGVIIDGNVNDPDVSHIKGATYEQYRIDSPTPGDWTMRIEGIDIPKGGEEVKLDVSGIQETPPEVALSSPADGSIVRGMTTISTEAKDNKAVTDFALYINGESVKSAENNTANQASISYIWDTSFIPDGYYHFSAMAFDPESSSGQDDTVLIVDNVMPVADAGPDQKARMGDEVTFNATNSKDVDWFGYYWDFGDGTTETAAGPLIAHTYTRKGKYTATLTVADAAGNVATDIASVKVLHQRGQDSSLPDDMEEPSAPQGLKYNLGDKMVHLVWSPNKEDDLAGYNIYRRQDDKEPVKLNTGLITDVQFQDRDVNPNKVYTYFVTAEDRSGNESDPSTQTEVDTGLNAVRE